MTTLTRYGASRNDIEVLLASWGEPAYRARQAWEGLWVQREPLEQITTLSRDLRARLAEALPLTLDVATERSADRGKTMKWLWRCADGAQIETVLMRYPQRATVCISSQAGCAMGCTFCATGQAGFERHLRTDEILEQVLRAAHASPQRVANVVFMGMGEPLANVDPVLESITRLHQDLGLSARHITVSTVGIVPGMQRLTKFPLPVTLAVSLHAPDDNLRNDLVPVNKRYPLADVINAARTYAATKGRRVSFEYACIAGVNDHPDQAEALARRLQDFPAGAHVNLIPLNPTSAYRGTTPPVIRLRTFAERLTERGVNATVRRNRGVEIDAACGQLRAREAVLEPTGSSATMKP
ncbi:MAG: rRNA m(2)A-2503 methyltransferase [Actinomycetia bacterium]|nr:rRNA m(2)A-2503 methyltransferase [Actinomycetes bacterium]